MEIETVKSGHRDREEWTMGQRRVDSRTLEIDKGPGERTLV